MDLTNNKETRGACVAVIGFCAVSLSRAYLALYCICIKPWRLLAVHIANPSPIEV